jgi:hypothetical protein
MARFENGSAFCPHCRKQVLTHIRNFSTTPWLVLGIITCGLFLLVWLVSLAIWRPQVRCSQCGTIIGTATKASGNTPLIVGGVIGAIVLLLGLSAVFSSKRPNETNALTTSTQFTPTTPANTPPVKAKSAVNSPNYKAGYNAGSQEGKRWAGDPEQGTPQDFALEIMASRVAEANGKDNDWERGWLDGFKRGFASKRGGRMPSAENDADFEKLSWSNSAPGVKIYDNSQRHTATVVSTDENSGLVYVRYVKSGSVEPKLLDAVAQNWFIKKK